MKTIKQVADQLGVSKDRVKYRVRSLPGEYLVKSGDIIYVTDEGVTIISELLEGKTNAGEAGTNPDNTWVGVQNLISLLEKELEVKNKQIADLSSQNAMLTNSLVAAQSLHAGTMKHLADEGAKPQSGFFSRIFGQSKNMSQGVNE